MTAPKVESLDEVLPPELAQRIREARANGFRDFVESKARRPRKAER